MKTTGASGIDPVELEFEFKREVHRKILERLERGVVFDREELSRRVEALVDSILATERIPDAIAQGRDELKKDILENVLGFGPVEEFLRDRDVDEVMVNRFDDIWIEKFGKLHRTDRRFIDETHLRLVIERMLRPIGKTVNDMTPFADGRLEDGSRINVVIPPLAIDGPMVTIRKFKAEPLTVRDLIDKYGSLTQDLADFLRIVVRNRQNIVISGGSGSGKTTLLNVLSSFIPGDERIITIEDSAELKLEQPHVGRLETRLPNFEGKGMVTIRDLVRNALRMRPDRIVVGECRGGETVDMLQAMNTGHDGSLTTVHANSPLDVLIRLETMCTMAGLDIPSYALRTQLASALDIIVQISRLGDGSRKVVRVSEILGLRDNEIQLQDLFEYRKDYISREGEILGSLEPVGNLPSFINNVVPSERETLERIFIRSKMEEYNR